KGRPRLLHLSEGQANDHKTAAAVIEDLPANALLADRAYSSAAFRQALVKRGITPCIHPMPSIVFSTATILSYTDNATGLRTCSHASKTGDASTPDTTDVLTPSCRRSPSLQPSSSGSMSPDPS
ncbi:hypothetical protein OOJ09_31515, partial [Mesorhizobium qingshengii]|nr:hypothetical protein [Mesorhizobium qingshengii]